MFRFNCYSKNGVTKPQCIVMDGRRMLIECTDVDENLGKFFVNVLIDCEHLGFRKCRSLTYAILYIPFLAFAWLNSRKNTFLLLAMDCSVAYALYILCMSCDSTVLFSPSKNSLLHHATFSPF